MYGNHTCQHSRFSRVSPVFRAVSRGPPVFSRILPVSGGDLSDVTLSGGTPLRVASPRSAAQSGVNHVRRCHVYTVNYNYNI